MTSQQTIVITGSTRGIGKGMAGELLKRGHNVVVSGRTAAAVQQAVADLEPLASGTARVHGVPCDVAQCDALQTLWDEATSKFGRVDIWINNAGISPARQRAGEMRGEDIRNVQQINLQGMMQGTRIALVGMHAQGGGTIYNMEGYGSNGMMNPGMGLYGASKFALTYFNKSLLAETRDSAVKICYLSPGIVLTDLLKRDMGSNDARDIARTRRIYNILADRVETVTPWLVDNILKPQKAGARVAWLTGAKAGKRFFLSLFRKRQLLTDADFAAD
jgi:NAD(P)-dependent dehydrogenase (short-subunit alcohol dehydrogenase family)